VNEISVYVSTTMETVKKWQLRCLIALNTSQKKKSVGTSLSVQKTEVKHEKKLLN
jgi:hypothetical protein